MQQRTSTHEGHAAPAAATVITVAAWLLVVASLTLLAIARPPLTGDDLFLLVDITNAAVYGTLAGVILWRRTHVVVWLLALTAIGCGLSALAASYLFLAVEHPDLPYLDRMIDLVGMGWVPGTIALFVVVPWLIRDHPLTWVPRLGVAAGSVMAVILTFKNQLGLDPQLRWLVGIVVVLGLLAACDAEWRHRFGPIEERVGLGWLALGTAVMALSFVPLMLPYDGLTLAVLDVTITVPTWLTPAMHLAVQAVFPAAILVSVLRQRLWGIDIAVSRTITAGALTILLGLLYVAVAALASRLLGNDGIAQIAAAALVVVASQPSRHWLQRRVRALVYGEGHDPAAVARRLSSQLGRSGPSDDLLAGLVESVATMLRLESAVLTVDGVPVASYGTPTSTVESVPLVHRGEVLGELMVSAPPGEALDGRDRRSLDELGHVVAAGLAVSLTSSRLERAQTELTSARLEERKVIRRELHDGLGPSLTGMRLGVQGVRNVVRTDPVQAEQVLAALQSELDARVDDVRNLSHSLLPPVLQELGLGPALTELAARHREDGLAVHVICPATHGLAEPLAAAVYAVASEALTNVVRHSGSRDADVVVSLERDALTLTVTDTGTGLPAERRSGVGTSSMRERTEEQGGTLLIESREPVGTKVVAEFPYRANALTRRARPTVQQMDLIGSAREVGSA